MFFIALSSSAWSQWPTSDVSIFAKEKPNWVWVNFWIFSFGLSWGGLGRNIRHWILKNKNAIEAKAGKMTFNYEAVRFLITFPPWAFGGANGTESGFIVT